MQAKQSKRLAFFLFLLQFTCCTISYLPPLLVPCILNPFSQTFGLFPLPLFLFPLYPTRAGMSGIIIHTCEP